MASRMKLSFNLQRNRVTQDDRYSQSQVQPQAQSQAQAAPIQTEEPNPPDEQEQVYQASICAANDFIHDLILSDDRWSSHIAHIRINCPYTLNELHGLGSLPQPEGVAACRKLIRVPVIHEELGLFVWTQLATTFRGPKVPIKESTLKTDMSVRTQRMDELCAAHLDDRFRFDKPASMAAWARRKDSPPISPREVHQRSRSHFSLYEDIEEGDEEDLEDGQTEVPATRRGRDASRSSPRQRSSARPDAERQRSFFSNSGSRRGSHVPLLKWSRERGTQSASSRASSTSRNRSGSLAGRLGSAVGGIGHKVVGALGDGTSQIRPRSRSRLARSL